MTGARPVDAVFFDLFGTLLSLAPLADTCERLAPGRGAEIAGRWRVRQLEASWLRTVMDRWADFDTVTHETLETTLDELGIAAPADLDGLANAFMALPLISDAADVVGRLHAAGLTTGILTNASGRTLDRVVARLGLPRLRRGGEPLLTRCVDGETVVGVVEHGQHIAGTDRVADVDVARQVILGACRPQLAHQALETDPSIAALLPCNVVVRAVDEGTTIVEAFDPQAMIAFAGDAGDPLRAVADDARQRLTAALAALTGGQR